MFGHHPGDPGHSDTDLQQSMFSEVSVFSVAEDSDVFMNDLPPSAEEEEKAFWMGPDQYIVTPPCHGHTDCHSYGHTDCQ